MPGSPVSSTRTAGSGCRWFASVRQLRVMVPGEGFGSTGPIEVKNGSVTKVEMPPLAKFGSIAGKLDPKLVGPGSFVHIDPENHAPVACDASGRFAFGDVPPGRYVVRVTKRRQRPGHQRGPDHPLARALDRRSKG